MYFFFLAFHFFLPFVFVFLFVLQIFTVFFAKIICLGRWYGPSPPWRAHQCRRLGRQSPLRLAPVSRLEGTSSGQGSGCPHHLHRFDGLPPSGHIRPHYWNTACLFLLALSTAAFHDHSGGHCRIMVTERIHGPQSLKYLHSGLLQEKFADP